MFPPEKNVSWVNQVKADDSKKRFNDLYPQFRVPTLPKKKPAYAFVFPV